MQNSFAKDYFVESDCPVLFELGQWNHRYMTGGGEIWGRQKAWFDGRFEDHVGNVIELDKSYYSYNILKNPKGMEIAYIGPWQKVTLKYPTYFWQPKKQIEAEIRMIATQKRNSLENHYEMKDDLNKDIPAQSLYFPYLVKDLITFCDIVWANKYGYNAVADYRINIFRAYLGKSILAGSGKIIDSQTGEIIADKNGKLVEEK